MNRGLRAALLFSGAAGAAFALLWTLQRENAPPPSAEPPPLEVFPRVDTANLPVSMALNNELAHIAARVMPGVVSIQVERRRASAAPLRPDTKAAPDAQESPLPSVGSGTIVRKDGLILTNWHVVEGAEESIIVTLHGEETARRAKLVDRDESRDLALLQIEPATPGAEFTALRFGDSGKVRVGHMVLAMGSPWGLRETVTDGIISHRARAAGDTYAAYLQTTCVINPGNSGGPLVNLQGDVIGIITRKLLGPEEKSSAEGYGLAIPANEARIVLDNLTMKGPQPYAGLTVEDWPERYWLRQEEPDTVIVKGVTLRSPAAAAGLLPGDIVETADGERTAGTDAFWRAVRRHRAGDAMHLTVRRGTAVQPLTITLSQLPGPALSAAPVRGVTVRPLRPFERSMLSIVEPTGLRVENVDPTSPFADILQRRTNILHVASAEPNGAVIEVTSAQEFAGALTKFATTGGRLITAQPGEPNHWIAFPPLP